MFADVRASTLLAQGHSSQHDKVVKDGSVHIDGRPRNAGRKHRREAARCNKTIGQVANEVVGVGVVGVGVGGAGTVGRDGGWGTVEVSDIAPMVITARSAYWSSCRALCFLPENLHGILNVLLIQLITAFQKVQRAIQRPLLATAMAIPPPTSDYYLKNQRF